MGAEGQFANMVGGLGKGKLSDLVCFLPRREGEKRACFHKTYVLEQKPMGALMQVSIAGAR